MIHGAVRILDADAGREPIGPCDLEARDDGDGHAHHAAGHMFDRGRSQGFGDAFGRYGGGRGVGFEWGQVGRARWGGGDVVDDLLAESVVLVNEAQVGLEGGWGVWRRGRGEDAWGEFGKVGAEDMG